MKHITLLILSIILFSVTLHAESVATITASKGEATIIRESISLKATVGMKLLNKDRVVTGANSKVQIIFTDETIISIGKNSNFSIEEYLFDETQEPVARFGMIGGAMRTITGKIGKIAPQKFTVTTKTTTIGIRGTNFTVLVNEVGTLEAYCTYGEISVSMNGKNFSVKQGYFITIDKNNDVVQKEFSAESLKKMKKKNFGLPTYKNSKVSKGDTIIKSNSQNDKQLNVTVNDTTSITIKDITEETTDTILQARTLDETISGYNMENATYYGNYSTLTNSGTLPQNGDVKLSINFAEDTARLKIGDFVNENPTAIYNFENVNKNEVYGHQEGNIGEANAIFYGTTGNVVNGEFSYGETHGITATGEYSAKTFENLH